MHSSCSLLHAFFFLRPSTAFSLLPCRFLLPLSLPPLILPTSSFTSAACLFVHFPTVLFSAPPSCPPPSSLSLSLAPLLFILFLSPSYPLSFPLLFPPSAPCLVPPVSPPRPPILFRSTSLTLLVPCFPSPLFILSPCSPTLSYTFTLFRSPT